MVYRAVTEARSVWRECVLFKKYLGLAGPMAVLACATTLFACVPPPSPQEAAALQAAANRPVTCSSKADCDAKWSMAVQWVQQHSAYKFQSATDLVIQTMGPLPDDPRPAFTVTRINNADGSGSFQFDGGCDNDFGCIPSMLESRASFVTFIMGQSPA